MICPQEYISKNPANISLLSHKGGKREPAPGSLLK